MILFIIKITFEIPTIFCIFIIPKVLNSLIFNK